MRVELNKMDNQNGPVECDKVPTPNGAICIIHALNTIQNKSLMSAHKKKSLLIRPPCSPCLTRVRTPNTHEEDESKGSSFVRKMIVPGRVECRRLRGLAEEPSSGSTGRSEGDVSLRCKRDTGRGGWWLAIPAGSNSL